MKFMNQSRLLSTTGMTIILLFLLSSCFFLKELRQSKQTLDPDKISKTNKINSGRKLIKFNSDRITKIATNSKVFDDLDHNLDNLHSDLLTDTAKILAGMNITERSELTLLKHTEAWSNYSIFLNSAWSRLEREQLFPIRQWSQQELSTVDTSNSTIFYPFSNGNFLQVYSLFPQGQEFILTGLEPVGTVPNLAYLPIEKLERELQTIITYLDNIFPLEYFHDRQDPNFQTLQVLPALYVFLAKTNNRIIDVDYLNINSSGKIEKVQKGMVSGVKITFITQGTSKPRFLYYFSADLSNNGLKNNSELIEFINKRDNLVTYLEKASYLMYFDTFSQIKNLILERTSYLLQDDSGIPFYVFNPEEWKFKFYGNYTQPIDLFKNKHQPKLWNIYQAYRNNIKSLNFKIGYQSEIDKSNLMLIETKSKI